MTIQLGSTTLCHGDSRTPGEASGPINLTVSEVPGVAVREFIGADRVEPEHLGCNAGTVSFTVARTYGNVNAALNYVESGISSEAVEGQLKFGSTNVFGKKSVVTNRTVQLIGCSVRITYTIQG